MPYLLLVKHSLPEIDPAAPAAEWRLGDEGRRRAGALSRLAAPYQPDRIFTSPEPKATETAAILGAALARAVETVHDLHEHARRSAPYTSAEQFQADAKHFFEHPAERVWGEETAEQAQRRFAGAVDGLLRANPGQSLLVVAHGTVISLLAARTQGLEAYPLWQSLGLPSLLIFDILDSAGHPALCLLEIHQEITA